MTSVVFLVNGRPGSPGGERARRIAAALAPDQARLVYRRGDRLADLPRFVAAALTRDTVLYAVDLAVVPVAAGAAAARVLGNPLLVDTGDLPADFLRLVSAGRLKTAAADVLERVGYAAATAIVVRGAYHEQLLRERGADRSVERVHVVPDGIDLDVFQPVEDADLRRRLGLADVFTVGISGSFAWFDTLDGPGGGGPGWELVHAIARLPHPPVHAVLIGAGPGLARLRLLAHQLGVADRLHVVGWVPYDQLPRYLGLCDVCLLTLSNHPSSWVRTSGKLPGYLATGRFVLASRVGTAVDILPEEMLLDYEGGWDPSYPDRLAERLADVIADPDRKKKGLALRPLAELFDYDRVAKAAAEAIRETAAATARTGISLRRWR